MPEMRIGKFEVLGTLGRGAHSTILHVRRAEDFKQYALKVVPVGSPDERKFLEQAEHEFRVAKMLHHPNLAKVYALETSKDWLFRVKESRSLIEYVPGKPLDEAGALPVPRLVRVFMKIAAGLAHMHRRGIYHADLKPNNILIAEGTYEPKVIDFGLAWLKDEPKDRVQGTPEYMAPETARKKTIDEKSDLFNFGATLYRAATFKLPPSAVPTPELGPVDEKAWQRMLVPPEEINPNLPAGLASLIGECLAFRPSKRPPRAVEVQERLESLAEEVGPDDAAEFG